MTSERDKALQNHPWWEMYVSEREYAKRILAASPFSQEREELVARMYDSAHRYQKRFRRNEALGRGQTIESVRPLAEAVHGLFRNRPGSFLEFGCGNGSMCTAMAKLGWETFGVDTSQKPIAEAIVEARREGVSDRCKFILGNFSNFVTDSRFDCVFNKSVFEHLIPDEVDLILARWRAAIRETGWLVFTWANRLNGPHDVSRPFVPRGSRAEGSHFFETTYRETLRVLRKAGFTRFRCPLVSTSRSWGPSFLRWSPIGIPKALFFEAIMHLVPAGFRPVSGFGILIPTVTAAR